MLNRVDIIGNLGADPEVRSFNNGNRVCNLRVAVTEKWKDKNGDRQEKTEWVSVAIFSDGLVSVAEKYLRKGSKVYVSGKLSTRKWQDQSGADRYTTEVVLQGFDAKLVMLDGPQGDNGSRGNGGPSQRRTSHETAWGDRSNLDADLQDDVPFLSNNMGVERRAR